MYKADGSPRSAGAPSLAGTEPGNPSSRWSIVSNREGAESPSLRRAEPPDTGAALEQVCLVLRTLRPVRDPDALPAHGFVISFTRKKKFPRLHHLGYCFRLPGLHYLQFEECGDTEPDVDRYMYKCRDCWPIAKTAAEPADSESGSESSSSDSSSTMESVDSKGRAAAKRARWRERDE